MLEGAETSSSASVIFKHWIHFKLSLKLSEKEQVRSPQDLILSLRTVIHGMSRP